MLLCLAERGSFKRGYQASAKVYALSTETFIKREASTETMIEACKGTSGHVGSNFAQPTTLRPDWHLPRSRAVS